MLALVGCKQKQSEAIPSAKSNRITPAAKYTGSKSCRPCHERFYKLWAHSHHGKAMQPFTVELAEQYLVTQEKPLEVKGTFYHYKLEDGKGWILQSDKDGNARYPMIHAMGGKNMFFFLTPLEKGRLQVLPISYNIRTKKWFDTMGAMVRHFQDIEDEAPGGPPLSLHGR